MNQVAVIDYGMGNLHSVAKAIEHVGADLASESGQATKVMITSDPAESRQRIGWSSPALVLFETAWPRLTGST